MNDVQLQNRIGALKELLKVLDGAIFAITAVLCMDLLCKIALTFI